MSLDSTLLINVLSSYYQVKSFEDRHMQSALGQDLCHENSQQEKKDLDIQEYNAVKAKYIQEYNCVRGKLGYFSSLNHEQFGYYLSSRRLRDINSGVPYQKQIACQIDEANYHFQIQAYVQIAKVCVFALVLIMAVALLCACLPTAILPIVHIADELFIWPAIALCSTATVISGFSGYGLFSAARKINPSAEDMMSYQSATGAAQSLAEDITLHPLSTSEAELLDDDNISQSPYLGISA